MPEHGDNALYKAARAVAKLEDFDFNVARHPLLGGNSLSVGNLHSGKNVNIVPDKAVLEVDIRTIPGIDHTLVQEQVRQYVGSDITNVEPFVDLDSVWTDPDHPWVKRIYDITSDHLGERAEVSALPFFTDAAVLQPAFGGTHGHSGARRYPHGSPDRRVLRSGENSCRANHVRIDHRRLV